MGRLGGLLLAVFLLWPEITAAQVASPSDGRRPIDLAVQLFSDDPSERERAFDRVRASGDRKFIAPIVQWLRFFGPQEIALEVLRELSGEDAGDAWHDWQLWIETHPETGTMPAFDRFKASVLSHIDRNFLLFVQPGVKHEIRLEEITWGGVAKDGIPALNDPQLIAPDDATYLTPGELVFGVEINGDARAYPLRIMDWHEMFNDVIGGVPVALAYCTLCGSGILFETKLKNRTERMIFGSSGLLYRSNKLMYDRGTNSLWNQFTGKPVVGPLTGSGIELKVRPVVISTWAEWLRRHTETKVLSLDTGYERDYRPGRPYGQYFASPELMFPAAVHDGRLKAKDYVFVIRLGAEKKAWPLAIFADSPVINDSFAGRNVVLIGDMDNRSVRAYWRDDDVFSAAGPDQVEGKNGQWTVTEVALVASDGRKLDRIGGHVGFWFAFQNFLASAPLAERP
ncbi:DUF3179 domain-containing protein [Nisaea acidiphila]|uniref:DUF3179 domain-containing protein n=1 Tax=Nisaea acidiphila TaxID=1862145 RepID=A0A9J7AUA7_9PROT|nr:DUF3179 domain-containing protein [Nisaea acidiphila]UUX51315.1 DUF3179 domain-containing protein [Nisaea acidiphila]